MEEFEICFDYDPESLARAGIAVGRICIGAFSERFESLLQHWTRQQYEAQWHKALSNVVAGTPREALFTSVADPAVANFIVWWPIYTHGGKATFQNQLLMLAELPGRFDLEKYVDHVGERARASDEGEPISEWSVGLEAIRRFLDRRKPQRGG